MQNNSVDKKRKFKRNGKEDRRKENNDVVIVIEGIGEIADTCLDENDSVRIIQYSPAKKERAKQFVEKYKSSDTTQEASEELKLQERKIKQEVIDEIMSKTKQSSIKQPNIGRIASPE